MIRPCCWVIKKKLELDGSLAEDNVNVKDKVSELQVKHERNGDKVGQAWFFWSLDRFYLFFSPFAFALPICFCSLNFFFLDFFFSVLFDGK